MMTVSYECPDFMRGRNMHSCGRLDMRKHSNLHAVVLGVHLNKLRPLLEPGGPYTAHEITACLRDGSMLMKYWLEDLGLDPVRRIRTLSSRLTCSDYGVPIRTTPTEVFPVCHNGCSGAQCHCSPPSSDVGISGGGLLQLPTD